MILGISGSPRKGGNTEILLKAALEPFKKERPPDQYIFSQQQHKVAPCLGLRQMR